MGQRGGRTCLHVDVTEGQLIVETRRQAHPLSTGIDSDVDADVAIRQDGDLRTADNRALFISNHPPDVVDLRHTGASPTESQQLWEQRVLDVVGPEARRHCDRDRRQRPMLLLWWRPRALDQLSKTGNWAQHCL